MSVTALTPAGLGRQEERRRSQETPGPGHRRLPGRRAREPASTVTDTPFEYQKEFTKASLYTDRIAGLVFASWTDTTVVWTL